MRKAFLSSKYIVLPRKDVPTLIVVLFMYVYMLMAKTLSKHTFLA